MKHKPKGFKDGDNVYRTTGYDDKGNGKNHLCRIKNLNPITI